MNERTRLWLAMEELRQARGWSMTELARRSGVQASLLYRWKHHPASPDSLAKIAASFGLTDTGKRALLRLGGFPASAGPDESTLADKLNQLWATAHGATEPEQTNTAVAEALQRDHGIAVSADYLQIMRDGVETNPQLGLAKALAIHFGVPAGYLLGDPEVVRATENELALAQISRDNKVSIAFRMLTELTPAGIDAVAGIVENIRDMERNGRKPTV